GDGRARQPLLRAHPLLNDGIIEGPMFGRHVSTVSAEAVQWRSLQAPISVGLAAFADFARATDRLPGATGEPVQLDAGGGVRRRLPGSDGAFHLDVARGLRDGDMAVSLFWRQDYAVGRKK